MKIIVYILTLVIYASAVNNSNASTPVFVTMNGSLPQFLNGSSGIDFDGTFNFWTFNDHGDNEIYQIADNGTYISALTITNATVSDWEDMTSDVNRQNLYIGDIGNNQGNRTNLKIYKIPYPTSNTTAKAEEIRFSYPDGNFDCESIYHRNGFIYLVTKSNPTTRLYKIPDVAGIYTATLVGTFSTNDNVTSADMSPDGSTVILLAERSLAPVGLPGQYESRLHLFTGFTGENPFTGNHSILAIANNYTQKEAVCFSSNYEVYLTDEGASKIYYLDISIHVPASTTNTIENPDKDIIEISNNMYIFDIKGSLIKKIDDYENDIKDLPSGIYILKIIYEGSLPRSTRFIKL
jgi:PKD repeat protein